MKKKVIIGSDHAGFELKNEIIVTLKKEGYDVVDVGTYDTSSSDYPEIAKKICNICINRSRRSRFGRSEVQPSVVS